MIYKPALTHACAQASLAVCISPFQNEIVHSKQPIALYGEDGFSPELWPLCQIRLRAAYSLLTEAACSNDP